MSIKICGQWRPDLIYDMLMGILRYIFLLIIALFSSAAYADDCVRYADDVFQYTFCIPPKWGATYQDLGHKHVITVKSGKGAEIIISASQLDEDGRSKWENWKNWHAAEAGGRLVKILETKQMELGNDAASKVLLYDFTSHGRRLLQRTMLTKFGDKLIVVECRAPLRIFARYTDVFNAVMSDVVIGGEMQGLPLDGLKKAPKPAVVAKKQKKRTVTAKIKPKTDDLEKQVLKRQPEPKPVKREEPEPIEKPVEKPVEKKDDGLTPQTIRQELEESNVEPEQKKLEEALPEKEQEEEKETAPEPDKSTREKTAPEGVSSEKEVQDAESEPITDPETRKQVETEKKELDTLEEKGVLEKVD